MTIELPAKLGKLLEARAKAHHLSVSAYIDHLLEHHASTVSKKPIKSVHGRHGEYAPVHPEEEIYPKAARPNGG